MCEFIPEDLEAIMEIQGRKRWESGKQGWLPRGNDTEVEL